MASQSACHHSMCSEASSPSTAALLHCFRCALVHAQQCVQALQGLGPTTRLRMEELHQQRRSKTHRLAGSTALEAVAGGRQSEGQHSARLPSRLWCSGPIISNQICTYIRCNGNKNISTLHDRLLHHQPRCHTVDSHGQAGVASALPGTLSDQGCCSQHYITCRCGAATAHSSHATKTPSWLGSRTALRSGQAYRL